jgi:hypothetical protein
MRFFVEPRLMSCSLPVQERRVNSATYSSNINNSRSSREPGKAGLLKRGIFFVAEVVDDDFVL